MAKAEMEKPPMGLCPKGIWYQGALKERAENIRCATSRYIDAKKDVPWQWIDELRDIESQLTKPYNPHQDK